MIAIARLSCVSASLPFVVGSRPSLRQRTIDDGQFAAFAVEQALKRTRNPPIFPDKRLPRQVRG
ncbi:hypothetical protein ACXYN8_02985 [Altererythrobacter sp. CAU 1778]